MDTQVLADAYGITPEQAANLQVDEAGLPRPAGNPYAQSMPAPTQQQQAPQPGLFDSMPFHSWLAQNAKSKYGADPWGLTDDQINKSVEDYADSVMKPIIGHQINQSGRFSSDKARNDELAYYKMQAQQELAQSLPKLREHFQTLKPQGAVAKPPQQEPSLTNDVLNELTRGGLNIVRNAGIIGGGLASYISPDVGDYIFKGTDAIAKAAENIPQPSNEWAAAAGGLIPGLINAPMAGAGEGADVLRKGGTLQEAELANAKNALLNEAMAGVGAVGGGIANPLIRRGIGATTAGVAGEAIRRGENALNPESPQQPFSAPSTAINMALGALGANKSKGLLNKEATADSLKRVPLEEQTNPAEVGIGGNAGDINFNAAREAVANQGKPLPGETNAAAENLATQATGEGNTPSAETPVPKQPLSKESTAKLTDSFERIADSDPKEGQTVFSDVSKDIPKEELPAFTEAFNNDWEALHGTRPIEEIKAAETNTTPADTSGEDALAAAAKEAAPVDQGVPTDVGGLLEKVPGFSNKTREPIGKGLGNVEVSFDNPIDKAAYQLSRKDTPTAQKEQLEEVLRSNGLSESDITDRVSKVANAVSTQAKAKGYKFRLSDQGKAAPAAAEPLRKPRAPKA